MRFGVNEVRRDEGGLFQGAGVAATEGIVALVLSLIFGPILAFFLVLAIWKMWPFWDEFLAFILLFGVLLVGMAWLAIWMRGHWAKSTAMTNRARVVHSSDQGVTFIHDDEPYTHTHVNQLMPDNGMGLLEGPEVVEADYPKTFPEMVREGWVSPGADYVVAFNQETGEAITWDKPTSLGIGGVQGSGKTVTTLSLMLQSVTRTNGRVRFLVCDPHMLTNGDESLASKIEGLRPFFLTIDQIRETVPEDDHDYLFQLGLINDLNNPTIGGEELEKWMQVVKMEMDRRLHGKDGDLWIIVIDEFSSVMKSSAAQSVADMIETVNQEARKMNMFAFLISQEWKGTRTGGTELRHSIASFVVHNMPPTIAELIVPYDVARKANTLTKGEVEFWTMGPSKRGMVPYTSSQDVASMMLLYSPRPYVRRELDVRKALEPTANTGGYTTLPWRPAVMDMPALSDIPRVQNVDVGDGIPVAFDQEKVEQVYQAWAIDGLSIPDTATRVFGVRSAWATDQVKEMLKGLVHRGYRS